MSAQNHDKSHVIPQAAPRTERSPEVSSAHPDAVAPVIPVAAEQPSTTSRSNIGPKLLFAPLIVLISTLPVGIGIGAAFRTLESASTTTEGRKDQSQDPTKNIASGSIWIRGQDPDELLKAGEYELALRLYESKLSEVSLRPSDQLLSQIALCREALGQWEQALANYQSLQASEDAGFRFAALLGQARISIRSSEFQEAQTSLTDLLRAAIDDGSSPASLKQEALYLFAMNVFLDETTKNFAPNGSQLIPPLHSLVWPRRPLTHDGIIQAEPTVPADESSKSVPSEIFKQFRTEIDRERRYELAEQMLLQLSSQEPKHPLAAQAKFTLGFAAYQRGALDDAGLRYNELLGKSSSAVVAAAAYNLGVVVSQTRDYRAAITALGRAIDAAPRRELIAAASILRGRALLEVGEAEQAAFDLKRAAKYHSTNEEHCWSAIYTGMAYLKLNKPQLAAEALFEHRDCLQSGEARMAAAFLVALARFESLDELEARDRETLFLFRALTVLNGEERWLGSCGKLLIGRAHQQLSQSEQMADVYSRALEQGVNEPIRSEMGFALAEHELVSGEVSAGLNRLNALRHGSVKEWSTGAALRLAEWELAQGHPRECLNICRELSREAAIRSVVLRLMGAANEQLEEYTQASERYAGISPE